MHWNTTTIEERNNNNNSAKTVQAQIIFNMKLLAFHKNCNQTLCLKAKSYFKQKKKNTEEASYT